MKTAIQSISIDTSPGDDGVLIKVIRDLNDGYIVKLIMYIMLRTGKTPSKLSEDKTILIFKDGDELNCGNYRPIAIYSIVRRIIEKVLDRKLREQISIKCNQRGFINLPGCHMNSKLINACLWNGKKIIN